MWTTLKNTARWQISSSILHGFMGAVSSAYGYAQDLNESLNNIRIVTGNSTEEMAKFAKEANKAAKALSTTTTNYTDAALIYYQQGLNEEQVKERADITVKMANVARESADIVSDQLTAVWNNFYEEGGQSLEHYADAMTALGAATASSTDEIAGGLEKFASIADMIGLSFDNAAAALATITATTRQSEEVVGTALKTIFARIQGLNLGETLDDGTTLNKYSEALAKVGISIYDAAGGLKDMDSILEEMGAKWQSLSKDQQVALAQTVAGVRQYNQLVSLMDNFDFYQQNLLTAQTSEGALNKQAEIYAESWEAAQARVRAAAEAIYGELLNDEAFIDLLNIIEKLLNGIKTFIDSVGGLEGVLVSLGAVITKVFHNQLSQSLTNAAYSMKMLTAKGREEIQNERKSFLDRAAGVTENKEYTTGEEKARSEALRDQLTLQSELLDKADRMSEIELETNRTLMDRAKLLGENKIKAAENLDQQKEKVSDKTFDVKTSITQNALDNGLNLKQVTAEFDGFQKKLKNGINIKTNLPAELRKMQSEGKKADKQLEYIQKQARKMADADLTKFVNGLKASDLEGEELEQTLVQIVAHVNNIMDDSHAGIVDLGVDVKDVDDLVDSMYDRAEAQRDVNKATEEAAAAQKTASDSIKESNGAQKGWADHMVNIANTTMATISIIQTLGGVWDTVSNPDASAWEKVGSVMMGLATIVPMLTMALSKESIQSMAAAAAAIAHALGLSTEATAAGIAAGATATFGTVLYTVLWPIGLVIAAIGLLVGIVMGVVKAFQYFQSQTPEGKLKTLQEEAQKSADAFARVTESVEETKAALESLDSAYETIENLTRGTDEWYNAITNVNAEVMKLLEKYPDLISDQVYATEDGMLKITEAGIDAIEKENRMRLQTAQNVNTANQIAVKKQEIEVSQNDFEGMNKIARGRYDDEVADAIQQYYETEGVGEQLFTKEGANALLKGLRDEASFLIKDKVDSEKFYQMLLDNQEQIRENANIHKQINILEDSLIQSRATAVGSTRSADEVRDLVGEDTITRIKNKAKEDVKLDFGNWNKHINYDKDDEEWGMIEDFMNLQGDDVEYVAQRHGKMVLEIDGEEIEYSKDEVYNALTELYSGPEIESKLEEGFEKSIGAALGRSVANLDVTELAELDNFQRGLADALTGTDFEGNSDEVFKSVANTWNVDTEQGFENFQTDTQYIDLTSEAFLRQALALNEGAISAGQFKDAVQELNAQGEILAMNDFFTNAAKGLGLDDEAAAEMQEYAEHLRSIAKESEILDERLAEDAKSAADLAVEITRMNKGIDDLADGFEEWSDILKKSSKESAEYASAMSNIKKSLSNVLDVESDLISSSFVEDHLEEIEKASQGDAEAIDFLRSQMDEEIIQKVSLTKPEELQQEILELDNKLKSELERINAEIPDIEVGAILQDQAFIDAANNLVTQSGMTADEANAYFAGIGYEPVYNVTDVEAPGEIDTNTQTTSYLDHFSLFNGYSDLDLGPLGSYKIPKINPNITWHSETKPLTPTPIETTMPLVSFSGDGKPPQIQGLRKKATGSMNNYSKSNSGGKAPGSSGGKKGSGSKGSEPKKVDQTKKTDIVDRYKQIEDQIDDVSDALDDASKAADRLYGLDKIKKMREVNSLLQEEVGLLEKKKEEAENYLATDLADLQSAASEFGVQFTTDENGNLTNYQTIMEGLYNQLHALETANGGMADEAQEEEIKNLKEKIDKVKEAISQYDETRELIEDIDNEIQDKIYEWQDNNYEILQYELELKIEINDEDLRKLDYYLNKYSDNFYKMAESAELLNKQIPELKEALSIYDEHKAKLDEAYANGEISQEAYIEGLKEVRDGYYDSLEALNELDKKMLHYYEDTLSEARSELEDYTDHMEHLTEVFDHYINLMDILGKSKNYEAIGDFLGGKADTIRDRLEVSKEYYNMLLEQKSDIEAKLNAAIAEGDDAAAELYKEEWDAIADEVDAAQEEVLSLTEEWAEAMKAVIENNMAEIAEVLEKSLTGGTTFDTLMDEFDKLNTRQEEYLTKTNQIYETNKLMRTASKALDETDNKVAKQKLKNFIDETKSLQENTKLSQYELEIQQAKYDLLLAEIALEEAQNAKSTVRLSRDSEGNFGYVYTADQDKVDDAQQAYEDADNRLYNLSLEGQQEFTEKYLQATQEMYNQLTELQQAWLDGEIASEEEYERRKEEILNHYLGPEGVLTTYQNLYNIAVRTDADATADNWQKDYAAMTQNTEDWKDAVNEYLVAVEEQTAQWAEVSEQANEDVEGALEDSATATKELTDESAELRDTIVDEVIPAIEEELDWVQAQTEAYAEQRAELLALIETYEDYIDAINQQIEEEAGLGYDKNTDYSAVMAGYLAAGGTVGSDTWNELERQREAKIEGEDLKKDYYGSRVGEDDYNPQASNKWYEDKDAVNEILKKLGIQTFSSGGYTGDWGPEGKLAILHEKELVLNAGDTANLLSTISFIRDLVSLIDSQATSASLYNLMSTPGVTTSQEVLEQKVEIYAEFPNATDHNEIEEAFNNLVNRASQYANRK